MVTKAMEQAGVAPAVIYAFRKTGRIMAQENAKFVPASALEAWQHAIDEYEALGGGPGDRAPVTIRRSPVHLRQGRSISTPSGDLTLPPIGIAATK